MATATEAAPVERQVETIPQLENGDHLTRDEFERSGRGTIRTRAPKSRMAHA